MSDEQNSGPGRSSARRITLIFNKATQPVACFFIKKLYNILIDYRKTEALMLVETLSEDCERGSHAVARATAKYLIVVTQND